MNFQSLYFCSFQIKQSLGNPLMLLFVSRVQTALTIYLIICFLPFYPCMLYILSDVRGFDGLFVCYKSCSLHLLKHSGLNI